MSATENISEVYVPNKLPEGWAMTRTDDGQPYYYHEVTKKTQWEPPTLVDVAHVNHPPAKQSVEDPWANMPPPTRFENLRERPSPSFASGHVPGSGHVPVLLQETVENVLSKAKQRTDRSYDGFYIDCTFGRGGHSREILKHLSSEGRLLAFDVDPSAIRVARELENQDSRFRIAHRPFGELAEEVGDTPVDGILMDLGYSSPQMDERGRGFNVNDDNPLDLRMNQEMGRPAWDWLQEVSEEELAWVIRAYGEDNDPIAAERIAHHIKASQQSGKVVSTRAFADIVKFAKCNQDDRGQHPAKLTFQAIRVFLNQEMAQLDKALDAAMESLCERSHCVVICFKQKESAAVRKFIREHEEPFNMQSQGNLSDARLVELYPLLGTLKNFVVWTQCEPIRPSPSEVDRNFRSRSAQAYVLRKEVRKWKSKCEALGMVRPEEERFKKPMQEPVFTGAVSRQNGGESSSNPPSSGSTSGPPEWRRLVPPSPLAQDRGIESKPNDQKPEDPPSTTTRNDPEQVIGDVPGDDPEKCTRACCRAMSDYQAVEAGYISFSKGQVLRIQYRGSENPDEKGFLFGCRYDDIKQSGWFPAIKVAEMIDT